MMEDSNEIIKVLNARIDEMDYIIDDLTKKLKKARKEKKRWKRKYLSFYKEVKLNTIDEKEE